MGRFRIWIIAFLSVILSLQAAWAEVPSWVSRPQSEDAESRFYIGRASGRPTDSEQALFEQATQDARNTAIAEQFGVLTGIERQSYQSLDSATSVQRVSELSKRVVVKGFLRADQFIKDNGTRKDIWVLFKYPKSEIAAEIRRLEVQTSKESPVEFSEVNATATRDGGFLELTTSPSESAVTIDGQSYGLTPIRVRLAQGAHSVFVDSPFFNHFEESVVIQTGKTTRLNKIMSRSMRKVIIKTNPSQASVILGGKYLGLSPVETEVAAGEKQTLVIEHPEAQIYSTVIEVGKGTSLYVVPVPDLALKPSYLSVNSVPQGADFFIDGHFVGKTPTGFQETRSGFLKIVKDGYINYEERISLRGGERRVLPTIRLVSISEEEKMKIEAQKLEMQRQQAEVEHIQNWGWVFSLGAATTGKTFENSKLSLSTFLTSLSLEKRVAGLFSVRLLYTHYGAENANVDNEITWPNQPYEYEKSHSFNEYLIQFPLWADRMVYVAPEIGILSGTFVRATRKYGADIAATKTSVNQSIFGFGIGAHYFWQNNWGIDAFLSGRKYGDSEKMIGLTTLSGRLSIAYQF
jgi:hypothetical protein